MHVFNDTLFEEQKRRFYVEKNNATEKCFFSDHSGLLTHFTQIYYFEYFTLLIISTHLKSLYVCYVFSYCVMWLFFNNTMLNS